MSKIILLFLIVAVSTNILNKYSNKVAFISTDIDISSFTISDIPKLNYDLSIIKHEQTSNIKKQSSNYMSLYISNYYYKNIICFKKDDIHLKQKLSKLINTFHYKNSDSYADIVSDNNICYERLEYIDNKINLNAKNSKLSSNYYYNLIHNNKALSNLLEDILNIKLIEIQNDIKSLYKWDNTYSYELQFEYDNNIKKFMLNKIYIYNQNKVDKELLNKISTFKNIYVYNKKSHEIAIYNNNKIIKRKSNIISSYYNDILIKTDKSLSVYHNYMNISLPEKMIDEYYLKYGLDNKKDKLCYLIHEVLTEDVYIEKNEFKTLVNEYLEKNIFKYDLYASQFIEQELSSDLSQQAYFSFYFCIDKNTLKKINYAIKFPIHFRYQPSLNKNFDLTHQTVVMPAPFIGIYKYNKEISIENNYKAHFYNTFLYNNIYDSFEQEIDNKLNTILVEDKIRYNNYKQLLHQIPAGQMKYFNIITLYTSLVSIIGFGLILFGIIKGSMNINKVDNIDSYKKSN